MADKKSRLEFIDLHRGLAVVFMIETHVTNAMLAGVFREQSWFPYVNFMNGLIAPSFLFCAGCGLWISLGRRWDDYLAFRKPLWVYFRRLAWILGVAYALHLPEFSMHVLMTAMTTKMEETLFQVDVLHVIALTMMLVVVFAVIVRNRQVVLWTAIGGAVALIAGAPSIWTWAQTGGLSIEWRNCLTEMPTSYFPFVPWSAFVFIGMAVTQMFMSAKDQKKFFNRLFLLGLLLIVGGLILMGQYNPWPSTMWRATPIFFAQRLGFVFVIFAGLWRFVDWRKTKPFSKKGLVLLFGRESLLVYVAHLIIVYGSVVNFGIAHNIAMTFSPLEIFGVTIALIGLMYVMTRVWVAMKSSWPRVSKAIPYVWGVLFLAFLLTNP